MSCLVKLKRLKDEVSRLFYEGFDEDAIVDQLRSDEQFAEISYEQVQSFYSNLEEEFNAEANYKRQIAECEQQIMEYQRRIANYRQKVTKQNRQVMEQQIAEYERELAREQRMKIEMEFVNIYHQNSDNFLLYNEFFVNQVSIKYFWQGRFFITVTTDNVHTIKIQDLLQGTAKSFKIRKAGAFRAIYALKFPFVLLREFDIINRITYFCLVTFDFENKFLEVVQSFELNGRCYVLVNASNASRFLLRRGKDVNECNLIHDQIKIGKKLPLESNFNISCGSYFDEQICTLQFVLLWDNRFENCQLTQVKMLFYNLEQDEHSTQDLVSTPENVHCLTTNGLNFSAWMRDTAFLTIKFPLTRKYGVIFANPQVRNWKFVDFATDFEIDRIQSFADGTLMLYSKEERRQSKIYKLQIRKPDFLRNMIWNAVVKLFKEAKIKNPYEEARQYLPLNSEIQPFVFTED